MKNMSKAGKIVLVIAACVVTFGLAAGATFAILSSRTDALTNTFEVGSVETEVQETVFELKDDTTVLKNPVVKNVGKNDCYIRARISISPADDGFGIGTLGENWELGSDGFYYYTLAVEPNASTSAIFTEVTIPTGWVSDKKATSEFKDFDIIVYQEAVQTQIGTEIDYAKIWALYDVQGGTD